MIRVQGAPSLKPARFERSSTLEVGDIVLAMGNPFGANAGLENGDVIIKVGDAEVTTAQQLQEVLAMHKPGDTVRITFIRPPGAPRSSR